MREKIKNLITRTKGLYIGAATAMVAGLFATPVFAAGDIENSITNTMNTIRDVIMRIGTPLYGLVAAACFIILMACSGRKSEMAKDWLIRATIAFVALLLVTNLATWINSQVTK